MTAVAASTEILRLVCNMLKSVFVSCRARQYAVRTTSTYVDNQGIANVILSAFSLRMSVYASFSGLLRNKAFYLRKVLETRIIQFSIIQISAYVVLLKPNRL